MCQDVCMSVSSCWPCSSITSNPSWHTRSLPQMLASSGKSRINKAGVQDRTCNDSGCSHGANSCSKQSVLLRSSCSTSKVIPSRDRTNSITIQRNLSHMTNWYQMHPNAPNAHRMHRFYEILRPICGSGIKGSLSSLCGGLGGKVPQADVYAFQVTRRRFNWNLLGSCSGTLGTMDDLKFETVK